MDKTLSKNKADLIISFICIGVGLWFLYESYKLPPASNPSDVGPGAFPLMISILLTICGVLNMISSFKNNNSGDTITFSRVKNTFIFSILLIVYLLLMETVGYYLTTIIMIPLLLLAAGIKKIKVILFILGLFLLIAFVGFDMLLGVPLP